MHNENAGNSCHKFQMNAIGLFTDFSEHRSLTPNVKQTPWL